MTQSAPRRVVRSFWTNKECTANTFWSFMFERSGVFWDWRFLSGTVNRSLDDIWCLRMVSNAVTGLSQAKAHDRMHLLYTSVTHKQGQHGRLRAPDWAGVSGWWQGKEEMVAGPVSEHAALCWREGVAITNTATENRRVFQNRGRSKCGTRGHGQA